MNGIGDVGQIGGAIGEAILVRGVNMDHADGT